MLVIYIMLASEKHDKTALMTKEGVLNITKAIPYLPEQIDAKLYGQLKGLKYPEMLLEGIEKIGNGLDLQTYMYNKFASDSICPRFKDLVDKHNYYALKQSQRLLGKAIYIAALAQQKLISTFSIPFFYRFMS